MSGDYGIFFTKLVASGNDFVLIDNISGELDPRRLDYCAIAKDICRRRLSAGADGLLVLESSGKADFKMRIINPDGTEVDMCGNGARCAAFYANCNGFSDKVSIETGAGIISSSINSGNIKLKMSDPKNIKMGIKLGVGQSMVTVHSIDTGVPHVVQIVDDPETFPVDEHGRKIREHSIFAPDGTNVNFVGEVCGDSASIRTYERGVEAETLACGTGTAASALILGLLGQVKSPVKIKTKSGEILTVYFKMLPGHVIKDVYLEGTARKVYEGNI
ncbi:MAG: diaminopimelate epimerase [Candidatus Omnitrophota bacterium]